VNVLFDINHPAHVHFFKFFIGYLKKNNHNVTIVSRDKDIVINLLDLYGFKHTVVSKIHKSKFGLAYELIEHQMRLFRILRRNKIDLIFSIGGTFNVHIAGLLGIRSIVFTDSEFARLTNRITFPFAYRICVPACYYEPLDKFKNKVLRYAGYHELAYLHPDNFKPDDSILKEAGLSITDKLFIIRFVSWSASHDVGEKGITEEGKLAIVNLLSEYGKVIITSESELPENLKKYKVKLSSEKMHHLLYYASIYIGEGLTMASEAAALGTPAILINSLRAGYIEELEKKYDLVFRYTSDTETIKKIKELLSINSLKEVWKAKRDRMIKDKINTCDWTINLFENELNTAKKNV